MDEENKTEPERIEQANEKKKEEQPEKSPP